MELLKKQLIKEAAALLEEYELLEPDNEYGWDSWSNRAVRLIIRLELVKFLMDEGVELQSDSGDIYDTF